MEQRRVGKDPVEPRERQRQVQEVLLPYLASTRDPRLRDERRRALDADRIVAELAKRREVASRSASEIEDRERRGAFDPRQQRLDVLADIVIARAFLELLCAFL